MTFFVIAEVLACFSRHTPPEHPYHIKEKEKQLKRQSFLKKPFENKTHKNGIRADTKILVNMQNYKLKYVHIKRYPQPGFTSQHTNSLLGIFPDMSGTAHRNYLTINTDFVVLSYSQH